MTVSSTNGEPVLFAAAHGFRQFATSRSAFDRSLYYNLLLQPRLAIPDHYFLQGTWIERHLDLYPARDSWLECGLRNGLVVPYFRQESLNLSEHLSYMEAVDRRGFGPRARAIAERIDRTPFKPTHWSSATNSANFGDALSRYLTADLPPMLENAIDPDDFVGFWDRSREWISVEFGHAEVRSSDVLGSEGILLSQLIQVSGERLLGHHCGRIGAVDELLARVRVEVGKTAERDLRTFYICACEVYNRSLADTLLTSPNTPDWNYFVAAMDLWREEVLTDEARGHESSGTFDAELTEVIRLPRPAHLQHVSGDSLLAIRRSQACDRYFESLGHWRAAPQDEVLQGELIDALHRYSDEIRKQIGKDVGVLGLRPQFISKTSDVSRALEKVPGVVQGFLAIGTGAAAGVGGGSLPLAATAGLFTLFCLQLGAKYYSPSERVEIELSSLRGAKVHADVTVSRP